MNRARVIPWTTVLSPADNTTHTQRLAPFLHLLSQINVGCPWGLTVTPSTNTLSLQPARTNHSMPNQVRMGQIKQSWGEILGALLQLKTNPRYLKDYCILVLPYNDFYFTAVCFNFNGKSRPLHFSLMAISSKKAGGIFMVFCFQPHSALFRILLRWSSCDFLSCAAPVNRADAFHNFW